MVIGYQTLLIAKKKNLKWNWLIKSKCFSAAIHNISFSSVPKKVSQCNWAIPAQGTGLGPSRRTIFYFPFNVTDLQHISVSLRKRDTDLQRAL